MSVSKMFKVIEIELQTVLNNGDNEFAISELLNKIKNLINQFILLWFESKYPSMLFLQGAIRQEAELFYFDYLHS